MTFVDFPDYIRGMKRIKLIGFPVLLALLGPALAAERAPLFQDDTSLKAVLTAPIVQAYSQRDQDVRIYFPGHWTYINSDGESQRLDVSIRTRGNFRREFCTFPPLQLNFKKSQVKGTLFKGQDKLKLVAPCQQGVASQQEVLKEYLAYRIFEILTDRSFGTRLIRLSYIDSDEKRAPRTDLAFVIEDDGDVAKRLKVDQLRVSYNEFHQLDQPTTALLDLFQFLIGNNDYSVLKGPEGDYCCHNTEMFVDEQTADSRITVPFDFDMSGIVHADYAAPPSHIPVKTVRIRYFRGLCQPADVLDATVAHVKSKRDEILAMIEGTEELSTLSKSRTLSYIRSFFAILDNEARVDKEVLGRCRGTNALEDLLAKRAAKASN
jgi:hypothetical protein